MGPQSLCNKAGSTIQALMNSIPPDCSDIIKLQRKDPEIQQLLKNGKSKLWTINQHSSGLVMAEKEGDKDKEMQLPEMVIPSVLGENGFNWRMLRDILDYRKPYIVCLQ
ncbi:unnamed protein product [Caretta caretta]